MMEISKHETFWLESEGAKMLMDLGVKQGYNVIDYGCGEGRYTIPLSQIVGKHGCVYSVERDENSISVVQERLPLFSNPDYVRCLKTDSLESLAILSEKSIDIILAFDVLQYVHDWDMLFLYFQTVLKPTGIVCIYPAAIPHPGSVDIQLLISKMEKVGFQYVKATTFRLMHNVDMVDDVVYTFCQ